MGMVITAARIVRRIESKRPPQSEGETEARIERAPAAKTAAASAMRCPGILIFTPPSHAVRKRKLIARDQRPADVETLLVSRVTRTIMPPVTASETGRRGIALALAKPPIAAIRPVAVQARQS